MIDLTKCFLKIPSSLVYEIAFCKYKLKKLPTTTHSCHIVLLITYKKTIYFLKNGTLDIFATISENLWLKQTKN